MEHCLQTRWCISRYGRQSAALSSNNPPSSVEFSGVFISIKDIKIVNNTSFRDHAR